MEYFKVLVNVDNLPMISEDDVVEIGGYYQTFWIEAADRGSAILAVKKLVESDPQETHAKSQAAEGKVTVSVEEIQSMGKNFRPELVKTGKAYYSSD